MSELIVNKNSSWEGIWKTRGGEIVQVKLQVWADETHIVGYRLGVPISETYKEDGTHIIDSTLDLMERIREGSDRFEKLQKEFEWLSK